MTTCPICEARVDHGHKHHHATWHADQQAAWELMHAHVENLIERVYALETGTASPEWEME